MRTIQKAQVGDTIRVEFNTMEEGAERRQTFEGILMKVRGSGLGQTITVRRISFGIGVERIFPVGSPRFLAMKVIRSGRVRRAKLYYLRKLSGKAHRVQSARRESQAPSPQTGSAPESSAATA